MKREFRESIDRAVNDATLTGALGKFSEAYRVNRAKAYEGIDFEALRSSIAERKARAAANLGQLADEFTPADRRYTEYFIPGTEPALLRVNPWKVPQWGVFIR